MAQLRLTLLGGFQARLEPGSATSLPTRKSQGLLAYLALPLGRAHPRDKLAALLWGGIREESARASLRQALFAIRKALDEIPAVRQEGDALALEPAAVEVDVTAFERAVREGTAESLAHAATLYQGDLLAGFALDESSFEEWLIGERERLRELALEGLAKLLANQRKTGATDAAVQTALKLLTLDPLQEPVHRAVMRLYMESGRRGAALRQYQHCVSVLGRELGIEPEPETKTLYQEILRARAQPRVAPREPPRAERPPGADGGATMIGRLEELGVIREALAGAAAGAGRVIVLLGEAGIGKSRLVAETAADAARGGVTVLLGRSYESEQILPFGPWVDVLRAARVADDADLLERLGPAVRPELARLVPDVGTPPGGAADVHRVFESVAQVIEHLGRRQPLLVVLEDLHWADELSGRLVASIGRRLRERSVLLLVTARADELDNAPALRQALDDLERDGRLTTLALRPLSRADTVTLVRGLARSGDDAALDRLGEQAWAASEGNPFVAVETVRAHAEGTVVAHGRGVALPERVREIVGRRLERLSERGQTLAAVAAVIGREFEWTLLERAAGLGEEDTASAVEELVRRHILHGVGERFDFAHDRIRETAYGRILVPRRRLLHRRVAEAIETLHAADLEPHALALGLHYRSAEVWDPAVRWLRQAGVAAFQRAANREAVASLEAALEGVEKMTEGPERSAHAIDIRVDLENALMGLGQFRRSLERLREAEALAQAAGDGRRLARVYSRLTYNLGSVGELTAALEMGERAHALATEQGNTPTLRSTNVVLSRALYGLGDYRRTIEVARRNDALPLEAHDPHGPPNVAFSRIWMVLAMAETGHFADGRPIGEEVLQAALTEGRRHQEVWARLGLGRLYVVQGALEEAMAVLEPSLPLCETASDLAVYFSRTASSLGEAYARSGRLADGVTLLERAAGHAQTIGFAYSQALILGMLGEARLLAGDARGAADCAASALELARRSGQRGWEARALRLEAEMAARREPIDIAGVETRFASAAALATELGMRPLRAHCHLGLAAAYARAGAKERAPAALAAARADYRAMDMPYWSQAAERALTAT
ncbi:MAG TPA: BTAD domain-containing putative transcriptional regulator [Methylomirabilota bacterium]|jgi:DNA-binding SARP family transcriptional activator|nr:BTAD domain-containing putative transcriptional regulator [Methylomirabilota bacterium]